MRTCMASEAFLIYPKRSCGLFAMQRLRQIVKYAADISLVEKSTVRKNPKSLYLYIEVGEGVHRVFDEWFHWRALHS